MPGTLTTAASVELAVIERSGFVESRHAGAAVVIAPGGEVVASFGDTTAPVLARSSLKPLQALASLQAGAQLSGASLGLATASHSGTDRHVETVREILAAVELTADALQCPASLATDPDTRAVMIRENLAPAAIRMNCSGKHAAMLNACVHAGWDTAGYLDVQHPLQIQIRELVERLTGQRVAATAIDGCGAPVFAVSLDGLARAVQRIGTASESSPFPLHRNAGALARAVREHPWTIAGPGQPDTLVVENFGVFSKYGAEGVMVMCAPDGTTVAAKTLDGSTRVGHIVGIDLLERFGALPTGSVERATALLPLALHGGGAVVGEIRSTVGR